jgi:hypothetical protein
MRKLRSDSGSQPMRSATILGIPACTPSDMQTGRTISLSIRMRSRLSHTRENLSTLFCNPSTPECLQKETNDGAGFCQVAENTEYRRYFFLWPLPCCDCTGGSYPAECRCAFAGADLIANASHVLVSLRMQRVGKLPMHFTQSGSRFLGDRTS